MTPPVVIGIDPGLSGAIAALDAIDGRLIWVEDMPALGKRVNAAHLADLLEGERIVTAAVEAVHAMPRQGVSSSFNFGVSLGIVLGVLGALDVPVTHPTPAAWKKAMGVTADKASSRRRATDLWPAMSGTFARVKDDGRAESALIARHAWVNLAGQVGL
jgi:crossover junction endodeoxyribonuclease RuvC